MAITPKWTPVWNAFARHVSSDSALQRIFVSSERYLDANGKPIGLGLGWRRPWWVWPW